MAIEAEALRARLEKYYRERGGVIEWQRQEVDRLMADNGPLSDLIHRSALAEDTARTAEDGRWHVTARDGKPRYNGEGEQWLQTWSEASATYDIACIDGDWSYGQEVDLLGMDAWRWLAPWPAVLAPSLPLTKQAADANR